VSTGGFLDIDCRVTGPDGKGIYAVSKEQEGRFTFIAADSVNHHPSLDPIHEQLKQQA
jgi:hypothetical protein